ncbi:MAG TPA: WGR domain-containing protein, partial [Gammaproteobacteria bacterium]|nr:WGR domain-containing protein [Gammaproteobacteria bacterium]
MPKQYYELVNDKSAKFWEVEQQNSTVHLRWGKIGTNGQSKIKELDSQEDAAKEVEKLINQKTKKGYVTAKASTVTTASPAKAKTTIKTSKKASTKKTATKNKPATIINPATASKPTLLKYVKDPSRTTAELKKSIERYVEVDRAIAQREEVSPVLLSKLSHSSDKNTRSKVIANPNISTEDYIRLGPQFPKEFLANPILDLILLEDPAILSEFDTKLLVQITKNPACSEGFLRWAASHKDEQVQLAVAMNSKTPEDALKILKASDHKAVKESLSSKAKVSKGATVDELEEEFVEAVKGRISGLPIEGKHHYSWETKDGKDRYETGLDDLWYYPKKTLGLPQFYLFSLKSKLSLVSSKCTEYHINKIKKHTGSSLTLRKSVASNILTPIYLLEELVNDSDSSVSENAKNSLEKVQLDNIENDVVSISSAKISKSERDKIAQQEKGFIKDPGGFGSHIADWNRYQAKCDFYKDAAGNINTSGEVLSRIANGISSIVHSSEFTQELKMLVAINPSTKKDTLVKLSKSKSRSLRRQLMKNPNLSFELESYLKRDENLDIEIYESKHTDTPTNRLIELSKHDSADVLTGVSEHFNTPDNIAIELINKLKQNKDASIRVSVSKNHLTSSSILDELANDKNKGVRLNVAKHDNTTENTLRYLVNDTTPHPNATDNGERFKIRDTAILSKNLANSLRAEILDKDKYIKIVKELCLPEEALLILGNSTNEKIKQAALSNTSHPEWQRTIREDVKSNPWFIAQLKKASEEVQKAVKENNILFFSGKDANKAVLSRRPISMILALSSGTNILPERIARVSKSTDWLIRAAVARNLGTPPNILKRLTEDSHSLVAALAKLTQDKLSGNISSTSDTSKLDTEQVAQDIAERIR